MRNMKTCWSQRETLTTLERWQRVEPPSHLPRNEVTSGAGRIKDAPMRSATHRCWMRMKWVDRSLMQLCRMLLMTQALAKMEKTTNRASRVAWEGPFRMETGVANSSPSATPLLMAVTTSSKRISSRSLVESLSPTTPLLTTSTLSGRLCWLARSSSSINATSIPFVLATSSSTKEAIDQVW